MKYLDKNVYIIYGAYIVLKIIGKLNWKWLTKLAMWFVKETKVSKITDKIFGVFGFIFRPITLINS